MSTPEEVLKGFLESKPASQKVVSNFKEGLEIGIRVLGGSECAYFRQGSSPKLELRPAKNPDVIFEIAPEAVLDVASDPGLEVGSVGIRIVRHIVDKKVHIKVPGSFFSILKNGYLGVISDGGAEFAKYLAANGVSNLAKIPSIIKGMKKG